jgi:predicted GNAT family N-acyltransferase
VETTTDRPTQAFDIRRTRTRKEVAAAMDLRYEVFCREQGVPRHEERDGRDGDGLHLIAVSDGEIIGTCRLVFVGQTVQFSRLAVNRAQRRQGVASALLAAADRESIAAGARRIVLHAQTYAKPLYLGTGYEPRGAEFTEAGIRHVAMEKLL